MILNLGKKSLCSYIYFWLVFLKYQDLNKVQADKRYWSLALNRRHSIRVDRFSWVGGAKEGGLFGSKIEHLSLSKIVNKINSQSFYTVEKVGALPNYTNI